MQLGLCWCWQPNATELMRDPWAIYAIYFEIVVLANFLVTEVTSKVTQGHYLRAVGRKVLWSSACVFVSLSVCAHCFCSQDISRTGSWITTKFGGWEQGVNL